METILHWQSNLSQGINDAAALFPFRADVGQGLCCCNSGFKPFAQLKELLPRETDLCKDQEFSNDSPHPPGEIFALEVASD